ncbi:MAG: SDR family NAD(P)-dependent oxidoreductase [Gaiellaceae bacterium]|jgi:short-subunit dehydrogenase
MLKLPGAVCLVTGASSGIGRATALELRREGCELIVSSDEAEPLEELAREIEATALVADLSITGAARELARAALAVRERVDVLVNAAGIGLYGPIADVAPKEIERVLAVNVGSPIELASFLLPGMLERRSGHIVNIGSIIAHVGRKNEAVYAASKGALALFTESLRYELYGSGVSASLVSPAVVETRFFARRGAPYDRRRPAPISAERVAEAVVKAVLRDRAEIVLPFWLGAVGRVRGLAPGTFRRLARRFGQPER